MDEKPVVLISKIRPRCAMKPGCVGRWDGEYKRCGTANVFCGVAPKAGRHFTKVTGNRSAPDFADCLLNIAASYPEANISLFFRECLGNAASEIEFLCARKRAWTRRMNHDRVTIEWKFTRKNTRQRF